MHKKNGKNGHTSKKPKANSFRVKDYMQTKVVTIEHTATMREAVEAMIKHKTNGLVVINRDTKVAGILSGLDIIHRLVPQYLEQEKQLAAFEAGETFVLHVHETADEPIAKFMTKKVIKITAESTLMEVAVLLSEYKIRQLPVVDKQGYLIGYINRTDVKRAIGDILSGAAQ